MLHRTDNPLRLIVYFATSLGLLAGCGDPPGGAAVPDAGDLSDADSATDVGDTANADRSAADDGGDADLADGVDSTDLADADDNDGEGDGDGDGDTGHGACDPNPCTDPNRSRCQDDGAEVACLCDEGYELVRDTCRAITCTAADCNLRGDCEVVGDAAVCECLEPFAGEQCEVCNDEAGYHPDGDGGCTADPCTPNPCTESGREACVADGLDFECLCNAGTHDEDDACVPDLECGANTCNMRGDCDDADGGINCSCDEGWTGPRCGECDADMGYHPDGVGGCTTDVCVPNPCDEIHRGVCLDEGAEAQCGCDAGYHEEGEACVIDEVCEPDTCSGNGGCEVVDGLTACDCDAGYVGASCDSCDVEGGYHDDGAGGCTDDACLPNPCTAPLQSVCVFNGSNVTCQCDEGAHSDGAGGCTTDPCTPNPCAVDNLACRVGEGGAAECYEPDCNDNNPCTRDERVDGDCVNADLEDTTPCSTTECVDGQTCLDGACQGGATRPCDDLNPCTDDSCDDALGCQATVDEENAPDDGVGCTEDWCDAGGFAHHDPDDAACDDEQYCTGVEVCDAVDGCTATEVPAPPVSFSPCLSYGPCQEAEPHFVALLSEPGSDCDDRIGCTSGDECDPDGVCRGTPVGDCGPASCDESTPMSSVFDIPVALLDVSLIVDGEELPDGGQPDIDLAVIYLRNTGTGALHHVYQAYYVSSSGPWIEASHSVVPGVYDVLYRRDYAPSVGIVDQNRDNDRLPNGFRVLETNRIVGPGLNAIEVEVETALVTVDVTLGGEALPEGGQSDSSLALLYLRAQDTGALHALYQAYYVAGSGPWEEATHSLLPGTYDLVYRRDYGSSSGVVTSNGPSDRLPNGYRVIETDIELVAGNNLVQADIPVAELDISLTLDGEPLPDGGQPDIDLAILYFRATDTGVLHHVYQAYYVSSSGPWVESTHSIVPGTYDVIYRRDYAPSDAIVDHNAANDRLPNGYRVLASGVQVSEGPNTLSFNVDTARVAPEVTLDGEPLPEGGQQDSDLGVVYLRAQDTGALHGLTFFYYVTDSGPWIESTHAVLPGTYDLVYRRDYSFEDNWVDNNRANDRLPNGYRVLATDLELAAGDNDIAVPLQTATVEVEVTVDDAPLPDGGQSDSTLGNILLRAQDTGALHHIQYFYYVTGSGPWVESTYSLLPSVYDVLYWRDYYADDNLVDANLPADRLPNGYRVLQTDVSLEPGANLLSIDVPRVVLDTTATLNGAALPEGGQQDSDLAIFYLEAADTGALHEAMFFYYVTGSGPWIEGTHSLLPGDYRILYRRDFAVDDGIVDSNRSNDRLPNGYSYLGACVAVE